MRHTHITYKHTHTHTHTHDNSIRRNAMHCILPKNHCKYREPIYVHVYEWFLSALLYQYQQDNGDTTSTWNKAAIKPITIITCIRCSYRLHTAWNGHRWCCKVVIANAMTLWHSNHDMVPNMMSFCMSCLHVVCSVWLLYNGKNLFSHHLTLSQKSLITLYTIYCIK